MSEIVDTSVADEPSNFVVDRTLAPASDGVGDGVRKRQQGFFTWQINKPAFPSIGTIPHLTRSIEWRLAAVPCSHVTSLGHHRCVSTPAFVTCHVEPLMQFDCQVWSMHNPQAAAAHPHCRPYMTVNLEKSVVFFYPPHTPLMGHVQHHAYIPVEHQG